MGYRTKEELLAHYSEGTVMEFYQLDSLVGDRPNYYEGLDRTDDDGDTLTAGFVSDIRKHGHSIRLQIRKGISVEDAIRVTRKFADWLERDPDLVKRMYEETEGSMTPDQQKLKDQQERKAKLWINENVVHRNLGNWRQVKTILEDIVEWSDNRGAGVSPEELEQLTRFSKDLEFVVSEFHKYAKDKLAKEAEGQ